MARYECRGYACYAFLLTQLQKREGRRRTPMELWMNLLFGNPIGLLSLISIAITLGVGIFFLIWFVNKSKPGA